MLPFMTGGGGGLHDSVCTHGSDASAHPSETSSASSGVVAILIVASG